MNLILQNICKSFEKKIILDNFSYEFKSSKKYSLLGENGSGKTTLLKIIADLVIQDSGKKIIQNGSSQSYTYIDSNPRSFFQRLSALENLYFFASLNGQSKEVVDKHLDTYFIKFIQIEMLKLPINKLSLGQIQIVSIIRGLLRSSDIILFDEAFSNLDSKNTAEVLSVTEEVNRTKGSIQIFASHEKNFLKELCDEEINL